MWITIWIKNKYGLFPFTYKDMPWQRSVLHGCPYLFLYCSCKSRKALPSLYPPLPHCVQTVKNASSWAVKYCLLKFLATETDYSRTSLIRPSMIRISGLTDPKHCLPTFSLKARSTMSDNTAFYTFSETINSSAL